ncbi:MAG: hypothetical protein ACKVP4_11610 [Hyphomicrobium sp.]
MTFALVKSGQLPNPEAAVGSPARVVAVNTAVGSWSALKTEARPMQHQIAADARRATEQKVATLEREVSDLKQARESAEAELARKSRELDAERTARQAAEQRATAAETRARQSAVEPSTAVERRLADATSALPEAKSPAHSASDESSPKNAAY